MDVAVPFYPCLHLSVRPLVRASLVLLSFQCSVLLPFPFLCPSRSSVQLSVSSLVHTSFCQSVPSFLYPCVLLSVCPFRPSFSPSIRSSVHLRNPARDTSAQL